MQLILGYETLQSYQRLSYKPWYALAEFVDNSTQSYRNHKGELQKIYAEEETQLTVSITYGSGKAKFIKIVDNAFGMSHDELRNALTLGKKPEIDTERSMYGLGLKTAAFWFGDSWSIETTKYGESKFYTVNVDLQQILNDEKEHYEKLKKDKKEPVQFVPNLPITEHDCDPVSHGTTVTITSLKKTIAPQTAKNCIEYLQSIYRIDLQNNELNLEFQDQVLSWDTKQIEETLLTDSVTGEKYKREFEFEISGKRVFGWAGILKNGARKLAGFSLLQADRVIMGYPSNYKPTLLFGDEFGGTNNLVNQRLLGELRLDGFDVSHTKDQILFKNDEEEELNQALYEKLGDLKEIAQDFRLRGDKEEENFDFLGAIHETFKNLSTPTFKDAVFQARVLPEEIIEKTNEEVLARIIKLNPNEFNYTLDDLNIKVLVSDESSPYDPYLIVKTSPDGTSLTIFINKNHPYWRELGDHKSIYNFLLSCLYDGVSEWKARFLAKSLSPDTIKLIKDHFLRLPLQIR
jgi:hypothetical protein